jgi:flagellar biosynthesis protein FlhB
MCSNNGKGMSINSYLYIFNLAIIIFPLAINDTVLACYFFLAIVDNIIHINFQVLPNSIHSQLCRMKFVDIIKQNFSFCHFKLPYFKHITIPSLYHLTFTLSIPSAAFPKTKTLILALLTVFVL